jgi:peptide/nickel transport system permease protein
MRHWALQLAKKFLLLAALVGVGGLLCATMVRFAPGFGMDERELDSRLSESSRDAIRDQRQISGSLLTYYGNYLARMLRGDFGASAFLERPISELLRERAPFTLRSIALGLLAAWLAASTLALATIRFPNWLLDSSATAFTGLLIALPTAVVALLCVSLRFPVFVGIALVTLPKLFRYQQNVLAHANTQPFVLAARARGVSHTRILFRHIIPVSWHSLAALLGVSASMAFGAAIPLEAFSDSPGVGQLAWQAALNRDLPLLTGITLLVTLLTVVLNFFAGAAQEQHP